MTSRRSFLRLTGAGMLGVGALTTLGGCDLFGADPATEDPPPPELMGFLSATSAIGDRYDATLAAVGTLPAAVTQVRDAHRAHVRALADAIGTPTPRPVPSPSRASAVGEQALAALVAAERDAYDVAVALCLSSSARFAPLVGSIAAARASHLEVLK